MEIKNIKKIIIRENNEVIHAIRKLNNNDIKILFVVNRNNQILGTITDGDIRRSFLKNGHLKLSLKKIMNKNFEKIFLNRKVFLSKFKNNVIPVLDRKKRIIKIRFLSAKDQKIKKNIEILIMAGGFGKRLLPYTKKIPKPMLKINKKPMIENIVLRFLDQGFSKFHISTHYKASFIKNYFKKKKNFGAEIIFLNEKKPLGTAGCLGLLKNKKIEKNILIHNADVISNLNYNEIIKFHNESKSDITVAAKEHISFSPFGEIDFKGIKIKKIDEKPKNVSFINAGIYIIKSKFIKGLKVEKLSMTDFIQKKIKKKVKVNIFQIHEFWSDIGQKEIFKKYSR